MTWRHICATWMCNQASRPDLAALLDVRTAASVVDLVREWKGCYTVYIC